MYFWLPFMQALLSEPDAARQFIGTPLCREWLLLESKGKPAGAGAVNAPANLSFGGEAGVQKPKPLSTPSAPLCMPQAPLRRRRAGGRSICCRIATPCRCVQAPALSSATHRSWAPYLAGCRPAEEWRWGCHQLQSPITQAASGLLLCRACVQELAAKQPALCRNALGDRRLGAALCAALLRERLWRGQLCGVSPAYDRWRWAPGEVGPAFS